MSKDKPRCCKVMFHGWQKSTCSRSGVVVRDGSHYCKQHDPKAVEARRRARDEQWDAERRERNRLADEAAKARKERESCYTACLAAGLSPSALAADPEAIKRLVEIVARLPKTADGVPVTPGMKLWGVSFTREAFEETWNIGMNNTDIHKAFLRSYSSEQAATQAAARGEGRTGP